jgi:hypothetical protein
MSHYSINKINGKEYIYCGVTNREAGKKAPKRRITYLGKSIKIYENLYLALSKSIGYLKI